MAFLFADSFDLYAAGTDMPSAGKWNTSTVTSSSVTRFANGRSVLIPTNVNTAATVLNWGTVSNNTVFISIAAMMSVLATGSTFGTASTTTIRLLSGGTIIFAIAFDPTAGSLYFYRGNFAALLGIYPAVMLAGVWTHLQFKIKLDATTGTIDVRKNGNIVSDFSLTGLNTSGGTSTANGITLNGNFGGTFSNVYFDDLLVFDSSGATLNDWAGDLRAFTLFPSSDTAQKDFVSGTGLATNAASVNESPYNGDTTYNASSVVGATDLYNLTDLPTTPLSIAVVQGRAVTRKTDAGTRNAQFVLKSGSTTSFGTSVPASTSYTASVDGFTTNPDTGGAWSYASVNALQAGIKVSA